MLIGWMPIAAANNSSSNYQLLTGTYAGFSLGVRDNYTSTPVFYKGVEGTLSLGFGGLLAPKWYLAIEGFVADNASVNNYSNAGNSAKTTLNFGGSLIPGFMITDSLLGYIRASIIGTNFSNQNVNQTGWQLGLGGETVLCNDWSLRVEYIYSSYSSAVDGIGNPKADQMNFGIVYRFG
ncbi:MAG: hypothetical protein A3F46_08020 [Legionellales bacterium RIFCSPHIGHO2_12_FULL_42_9]|nr:MAG: hypothetical protein A3F46_08020 [Legionellales bacterium RIFCSPHIGHO2_12_FULL_42_9]